MVEAAVRDLMKAEGVVRHSPITRDLIKSYVSRVTIRATKIEIKPRADDTPRDTISLPWSSKPFIALKGIASGPSSVRSQTDHARNRGALLAAIARARVWVGELMDGQTLNEIARREGKGERQIRLLAPLAFMSPRVVRDFIDGVGPAGTATTLARNVPLLWDVDSTDAHEQDGLPFFMAKPTRGWM